MMLCGKMLFLGRDPGIASTSLSDCFLVGWAVIVCKFAGSSSKHALTWITLG